MSSRKRFDSGLKRRGFEKAHGISSLRRCAGTREEEDEKERIADELLRETQPDNYLPVRTEMALARQTQLKCPVSLDGYADNLISQRPAQSSMDELKFLMSVTDLSRRERYFLRGWILGWTQEETSAKWLDSFGSTSRFIVCRSLRRAMEKCRDNSIVSFNAVSRHAVYRRPARKRESWRTAVCPHCKEPFLRGLGDGGYCSVGCRCAAALGS